MFDPLRTFVLPQSMRHLERTCVQALQALPNNLVLERFGVRVSLAHGEPGDKGFYPVNTDAYGVLTGRIDRLLSHRCPDCVKCVNGPW